MSRAPHQQETRRRSRKTVDAATRRSRSKGSYKEPAFVAQARVADTDGEEVRASDDAQTPLLAADPADQLARDLAPKNGSSWNVRV